MYHDMEGINMRCTQCGEKNLKRKTVKYQYVECGLDNVYLHNISLYVCQKCKEEEVLIPNMEGLHKLIVKIIASQKQRLAYKEIRFLRSYLGYSGKSFAEFIRVKPETVSRWEKGREKMSISSEILLRILVLDNYKPRLNYEKELPSLASKPLKRVHEKKSFEFSKSKKWKIAA